MRPALAAALLGLLKNVPKDELREFIHALDYYNSYCSEDVRALCAVNGCKRKKDEALELAVITALKKLPKGNIDNCAREFVKKAMFEWSSQSPYFTTSRPVCPCCKR